MKKFIAVLGLASICFGAFAQEGRVVGGSGPQISVDKEVHDYGTIDNYVQFPGTTGYTNGDFNYDGTVDGADYGLIDNAIQFQGEPL